MRPWIFLAGLNGVIAIGLAAYGAHGVAPAVVPLMEKASQFQMIHAVALLGVGRLAAAGDRGAMLAGILLVLGVTLFSGSLYFKALAGPLAFPLATPAGGICLMLGWLSLAASSFRNQSFRDLT